MFLSACAIFVNVIVEIIMENNVGKAMLPFKAQQLLNTIIKKRGLCVEDAMHYLYSSSLYRQLSLESSYLWQLSTLHLYDLLKKEKRLKKQCQNNTKPLLLFFVFCLENYKSYKSISVEEALLLFNNYNVIDYLESVYDTLHSQGKGYIMSEIDSYIINKSSKK